MIFFSTLSLMSFNQTCLGVSSTALDIASAVEKIEYCIYASYSLSFNKEKLLQRLY